MGAGVHIGAQERKRKKKRKGGESPSGKLWRVVQPLVCCIFVGSSSLEIEINMFVGLLGVDWWWVAKRAREEEKKKGPHQ